MPGVQMPEATAGGNACCSIIIVRNRCQGRRRLPTIMAPAEFSKRQRSCGNTYIPRGRLLSGSDASWQQHFSQRRFQEADVPLTAGPPSYIFSTAFLRRVIVSVGKEKPKAAELTRGEGNGVSVFASSHDYPTASVSPVAKPFSNALPEPPAICS